GARLRSHTAAGPTSISTPSITGSDFAFGTISAMRAPSSQECPEGEVFPHGSGEGGADAADHPGPEGRKARHLGVVLVEQVRRADVQRDVRQESPGLDRAPVGGGR